MPEHPLTALGLDPDDLPARARRSLIDFLLRWEEWGAALECADALLEAGGVSASRLDDRARALLGLGRAGEALEVMRRRNAHRRSPSSRILEARCRLADGDAARALEEARAIAAENPEMLSAWSFLVEAALAAGVVAEARDAASRLRLLGSEDHRAYLLAMLAVSEAAGERVAASAYAVRLEGTADAPEGLPASLLRRLLAHYRSSGEGHRAAEMEAALRRRHDAERAHLADALVGVAPRAAADLATGRVRPEALPATRSEPAAMPAVPEGERARLTAAARRLFGHAALLPGQAETIAATLCGEDVLTVLPTGGGKSLCYQLPAFLEEGGTTLVISPLIALMKDQVDSLPPGLARVATTINSSLEGDELRRRLARVAQGCYRLVYAAPERLRQPTFLHALRRAPVRRLVVDEAHCVSLWGHDFRPDYLYVGRARELLGAPPVLAMTATAPPRVREDILQRLRAAAGDRTDGLRIVAAEVERPNLFLEVVATRNQDAKLRALLGVCAAAVGSGIVYVGSRERAEHLAELLRGHGHAAEHYHAGIDDPALRAARQDALMCADVRVMVATIAFGMGIDKADIRFIVHYDPPSSLEAYWQEAGRAGRDGEPARCVLFHAPGDRGVLTRRAHQDQIGIEELRRVYRAVRRRVGRGGLGAVPMADLCRDLGGDGPRVETRVRVALSLLEEAGQLRRHQDLPRLSVLHCRAGPPPGTEEAALWARIGLAPATTAEVNLVRLAQSVGVDPLSLEERLCAWEDAGYLSARHVGRDLLLEVLPPSPGAARRVQELLDEYDAVQIQRVAEVVAYARTRRCRSGHIAAYLSGRGAPHCASCDNCCPRHPLRRRADPQLPDEREQAAAVLGAVEGHGWGRQSLIRILRAEARAPEAGMALDAWGALAFRSRDAVRDLIACLERAGLLAPRTLDHGGIVLELTAAGRRALARPALLAGAVQEATAEG